MGTNDVGGLEKKTVSELLSLRNIRKEFLGVVKESIPDSVDKDKYFSEHLVDYHALFNEWTGNVKGKYESSSDKIWEGFFPQGYNNHNVAKEDEWVFKHTDEIHRALVDVMNGYGEYRNQFNLLTLPMEAFEYKTNNDERRAMNPDYLSIMYPDR